MIYITPFRQSDKQATGPSEDSGFSSIEEARQAFGEPSIGGPSMLIYNDGEQSCLLSRVPFNIDADGNKA